MAESWVGAARGVRDLVYFAVAEHATAGIIRDGRPVTGAHGRAPAVAWLSLNPVEREDYRRAGCLDAEVAAAGIVRRLIWRIKAGDRSHVQDMANGDLTAITVDLVLDAARSGDGVSISVMRDTAKYLGMAAANLVAIADPEVLVLGGIMASATDLLLEPLRTELTRRLPASMVSALTISTASLGADAAALGAARHAFALHVIVLSGADLVLPDRILSPGTLVIDGDRIGDIRPGGHSAGAFTVITSSPASSTCTCTASTASIRSTRLLRLDA